MNALVSAVILFSLMPSFAYSLLLAGGIWRSRKSTPKWTLDVDFNHFHEARLEWVLFTFVLPPATLLAAVLFLLASP